MSNNRRDFIKKVGITAGAISLSGGAMAATSLISKNVNYTGVSEEEKQFLYKLTDWVNNYYHVVQTERKKGAFKNNKKIADLADDAGEWMYKAKKYMDNEKFQEYFLVISNKLTDAITQEY